jgi:hypothetical protein
VFLKLLDYSSGINCLHPRSTDFLSLIYITYPKNSLPFLMACVLNVFMMVPLSLHVDMRAINIRYICLSFIFADGNSNGIMALKGNYGNAVVPDVVDYYNTPPLVSKIPETELMGTSGTSTLARPASEASGDGRNATDTAKGNQEAVDFVSCRTHFRNVLLIVHQECILISKTNLLAVPSYFCVMIRHIFCEWPIIATFPCI